MSRTLTGLFLRSGSAFQRTFRSSSNWRSRPLLCWSRNEVSVGCFTLVWYSRRRDLNPDGRSLQVVEAAKICVGQSVARLSANRIACQPGGATV